VVARRWEYVASLGVTACGGRRLISLEGGNRGRKAMRCEVAVGIGFSCLAEG